MRRLRQWLWLALPGWIVLAAVVGGVPAQDKKESDKKTEKKATEKKTETTIAIADFFLFVARLMLAIKETVRDRQLRIAISQRFDSEFKDIGLPELSATYVAGPKEQPKAEEEENDLL